MPPTIPTSPNDIPTTAGLILAALLSALAWALAVYHAGQTEPRSTRRLEGPLLFVVIGIAGVLFLYRAMVIHHDWVPLQAHVDGLLLLAALLGGVTAYLQWAGRLPGVNVFVLPVITVLLAWGVCASWWTFRPFRIHELWGGAHLFSVYLGTLAMATAAGSGAMFLYVRRAVRGKNHAQNTVRVLGRMASLESIERTVIAAASIGFVFLSLALITGLMLRTERPEALGPGWWHSPKVVLAVVVWLVYAVIMHIRFAPSFRGRRAAWLSILGFVLLLVVLAIAASLSSCSGSSYHGAVRIGSDGAPGPGGDAPASPSSPEIAR